LRSQKDYYYYYLNRMYCMIFLHNMILLVTYSAHKNIEVNLSKNQFTKYFTFYSSIF